MTYTVQSRSLLWGDAIPRHSTGQIRPLMAPNRPWLTIHYTGSAAPFSDADDSPAEIVALQRWATSAKKPWEYNYIIDQQGTVWTYAGEYQAAHSAGENSLAYGVLLLLEIGAVPSDACVEAVRRLRLELQVDGKLAEDHEVRPHKDMPMAATPCPGPAVMSRWADLVQPWQPVQECQCPPEQAVFDPFTAQWGVWPINPNKPDLRLGSTGDAVRYLQGVIAHKAGGNISIDGQFGPQTEGRVKDLQRLFALTVDGWVGQQTWGAVDMLANL